MKKITVLLTLFTLSILLVKPAYAENSEITPRGQGEIVRTNTPGFSLSALTQLGGLSLPLIITLTLGLFALLVLLGLGFYKFIYLKKLKKDKPTKDLQPERPETKDEKSS